MCVSDFLDDQTPKHFFVFTPPTKESWRENNNNIEET